MKTLDRSRHYGIVIGLEPIAFQQDGLLFFGNGQLVVDAADGCVPKPETALPEEADAPKATERPGAEDDMRKSTNRALRVAVENYGEEWRGPVHAREFLKVRE